MPDGVFSHAIFLNHSVQSLCFFSLAMSFISLWVKKTPWLWGSFLFMACILAFNAQMAHWISLIPILILAVCYFFLKHEIRKGARFLLFGIVTLVSFALSFHFLPGFYNWQIASNLSISPGAYPYNLWLNFDVPFIGIFALASSVPLISSRSQLFKVLKVGIPLSLLGILIMMGLSLYFDLVKWDPKIPVIFFVWSINNLVLVTIPQETFFRGVVQQEIYKWFREKTFAGVGSVVITSLMFTLIHVIWVANFPFLCLVFVASLLYGMIYQLTKSIEASILCHFCLNLTHFLLFSYPALK